ncbi:thiamine pyrophosphokinase 1-like, partial [Cherax quadricarinatus]|uniref:thiamine pyrophosphokinase 1-like n=1 Tax=Cherax quadricarinatus TaxID=27406 RepID=UPI00387EC088
MHSQLVPRNIQDIIMENGDGKLCWKPKEYYHPSPGLQYGIVLLNEAVNKTNVHYVSFLWQHASVRVCVDGAINAYHKLMRCQNTSFESSCCTCPLPEIITGDFDSAKSELLKLYSTLGVNVVPTPSQEETDFTKAIRVLGRFTEERSLARGEIKLWGMKYKMGSDTVTFLLMILC